MVSRVISTMFCLLFLINCNDKSTKLEALKEMDQVKVVLEARVDNNDRFQLFYITRVNDEYNEKKIINQIVIGSPVVQKIEFELPKNIYPVKLRLDLGDNKQQSVISVKNISVIKGDKVIGDKGGDFQKFWTINQFMKYEAPTFNFTLHSIGEVYDPMVVSNLTLEKELKKLKPKDTETK